MDSGQTPRGGLFTSLGKLVTGKPRALVLLGVLAALVAAFELSTSLKNLKPVSVRLRNIGESRLENVRLTTTEDSFALGILYPSGEATVKIVPSAPTAITLQFDDSNGQAIVLETAKDLVSRAQREVSIYVNSKKIVSIETH